MSFYIRVYTAPSAFVSHSFARQVLLALLATRDIASAKTTLSYFCLALPTSYARRSHNPKVVKHRTTTATKMKELGTPNGVPSSFGCGDGI